MKYLQNLKFIPVLVIIFLISCAALIPSSGSIKQSTQIITSFEGKIIYDLIVKDKTGKTPKAQMAMVMGTEQVYTIKGNKYKSETNGMMKMTQYYTGNDSLFNQIHGVDKLLFVDVKTNFDEMLSYEITENAETIAGIACDLLTIKSKGGTIQYFYNKKYAVDPRHFAEHEYGFWKFCIEKTQALPLKCISDNDDALYMEATAKEIVAMKVADSVFELPALPRAKSAY